jgi:hypothetical protein
MHSLLARRLFGLAAGTLALLVLTERADASTKAAPKKDADAAEAKADEKKSDKKKGADDADSDSKSDEKKGADDAESKDADKSSDEKDEKADAKKKDKLSDSSAAELDGKDYYFVGLRYRHTILPKFLINLFADGGPSVVSVPGFGIEASKRRDGFEMVGALTYVDYSMNPFPFKGKNEADYAYEIVESKLKMINATADFLWSSKLSGDNLQFLYGLTAGIGLVWGDLYRTQAKPANGGSAPGDPNTYVPCQTSEKGSTLYCSGDNNHYPGYSEPSWAGGGYRPIIYPTFGMQLGLRWKPIKQVVGRLDVGYNLFSGFFFGLGVDYGI